MNFVLLLVTMRDLPSDKLKPKIVALELSYRHLRTKDDRPFEKQEKRTKDDGYKDPYPLYGPSGPSFGEKKLI